MLKQQKLRLLFDVLSRLLHPSDSRNYEPIDDKIPTSEYSLVALKKRPKEKDVLSTSFIDNDFETVVSMPFGSLDTRIRGTFIDREESFARW